jgi:hypothetical protein
VIDASGTWNKLVQEVAIRMAQAGVKPTTWVAVGAELQGDWRNLTGPALGQIMGEHLPFYGNLTPSPASHPRMPRSSSSGSFSG